MKKGISRITTRWFDSGRMVKAMRFTRVVVETRPVFWFPVFATGSFARPRYILVTYFLWRLGRTWLHLSAPYSSRIAVSRRLHFHRAGFESCRTTTAFMLLRWFAAVILATRVVAIQGGASLLCWRTAVVVSRTVFNAFVVVVDVVVVVEV